MGDVDGDAMCLDVKAADCGQTRPALSLAPPMNLMSTEVGGGMGEVEGWGREASAGARAPLVPVLERSARRRPDT